MEILRAETGARTTVDPRTVSAVRSHDDLRRTVARAAGVPAESQILMLPSGAQVKEGNLGELLSPGVQPAALLVFDRVLLGRNSIAAADLVRPLVVHPEFEPASQLPEVPRNASVAEQCAAHSEHFRHHLQQLEHYSRAASAHVLQLLECLSEMRVQATALNVALKNLDMHAT
ncbi:MAG: hypothetical protein BJ554DRAFT_3575 [Olpidium bornovanus]|uniref:Autophagy-related protein 11 n=1 Tax=Olpidium bornovanus TaxID=278681 RepID=A0A8H7ZPD4_9FUNG|nr:MAG: hypothetical protein BJ554DRAFT_3575 [Olpidium bornovanus]